MRTHPTMRFGDVLVVFEGRHRITWRRSGRAEWTPVALWPDSRQAAMVRRHIAVREPLLVVVERPESTITLLGEQLAAAPPAVAALADGSGDAVDLRLAAFDWLPEEERERGLRFLRASAERAERLPASLLTPVVLDQPDRADAGVRFLHVRRPWVHLERDLGAVVEITFGERALAAA
jgi:hypothetical protein